MNPMNSPMGPNSFPAPSPMVMNTLPNPVTPRTPNHLMRRLAAIGLAASATFGGFKVADAISGGNSSNDVAPATTDGGFANDSHCEALVEDYAAAVGSSYTTEAFLPKYDTKDAQKYVKSLFDKNGPLSRNGDLVSSAAFFAVITGPANDGTAVNPEYNYGEAFKAKVAQYKNDGLETARKDCETSYDTALQTASYIEGWAHEGDVVTHIAAIRDKDTNRITGMLYNRQVTIKDLDGVRFKLPDSHGNIDDFTEVLVGFNGDMWVKGVTTGENVKIDVNGAPITPDTTGETVPMTEVEDTDAVVTLPAAPTTASTATTAPANSTPNTVGTAGVTPSSGATGTTPNTTGGKGPTGTAPSATSTPDAPGTPDQGTTPTDIPGTVPGTTPNTTPGTSGDTVPTGTTPNTTPATTKPTTPTTGAPSTSTPTTPKPTTPTTTKPTTPPTVPPTTAAPTTTTQPPTTTSVFKPPFECDPNIEDC